MIIKNMLPKAKEIRQENSVKSKSLEFRENLALYAISILPIFLKISEFLSAEEMILLALRSRKFMSWHNMKETQLLLAARLRTTPHFFRLLPRLSELRFYSHIYENSVGNDHFFTYPPTPKLSYWQVIEALRNLKSIVIALSDSKSTNLREKFLNLWETCNENQKISILNAVIRWGSLSLIRELFGKYAVREDDIIEIWRSGKFLPDESEKFNALFQSEPWGNQNLTHIKENIRLRIDQIVITLETYSIYNLFVTLCLQRRIRLANNIYSLLSENQRLELLKKITAPNNSLFSMEWVINNILTAEDDIAFKRTLWTKMTDKLKERCLFLIRKLTKEWGCLLLSLSNDGIQFIREILSDNDIKNLWNNFYKKNAEFIPANAEVESEDESLKQPLTLAGIQYMRLNFESRFKELLAERSFFELFIYKAIRNGSLTYMQDLFENEFLNPFYKPYFASLDWNSLFLTILNKSGIFTEYLATKLDWISKEIIPAKQWQAILKAGFAQHALQKINSYFLRDQGVKENFTPNHNEQDVWVFSERDQLSVYTWVYFLLKSQKIPAYDLLLRSMFTLFLKLITLGYLFLAEQIYTDFAIQQLLSDLLQKSENQNILHSLRRSNAPLLGSELTNFDTLLSMMFNQSWCPIDSMRCLTKILARSDINVSISSGGVYNIVSGKGLSGSRELFLEESVNYLTSVITIESQKLVRQKLQAIQPQQGPIFISAQSTLDLWNLNTVRARMLNSLDQKIKELQIADEYSQRKARILEHYIRPALTFTDFFELYFRHDLPNIYTNITTGHKFIIGDGETKVTIREVIRSVCLFNSDIGMTASRKIFFVNPSNPDDKFWENPAQYFWELLSGRQEKLAAELFNLLPSERRQFVIQSSLDLLSNNSNSLDPNLTKYIENWLNDKLATISVESSSSVVKSSYS